MTKPVMTDRLAKALDRAFLNYYTTDPGVMELRDAYREALTATDPRDAVVEAAVALIRLRNVRQYDLGYSVEAANLSLAVNALTPKPKYEAWGDGLSGSWAAGVRTKSSGRHPEYANAVFGGPNAREEAEAWAARKNAEGK